jgi:hypothetical protein
MSRFRASWAMAGALLVGASVAAMPSATAATAPASAAPASAPAASGPVGPIVEPPVGAARAQAASRARTVTPFASNMTYHGGVVQQTGSLSVPIFWLPATLQNGAPSTPDPNYVSLIERYFNDVGGSGFMQILPQYYMTSAGSNIYIKNSSGLLQAIVDTSAYPAAGTYCFGSGMGNCIDDTAVRAEVQKQLTANPSLPQNRTAEYYVYLGPGESECAGSGQCFDTSSTVGSGFAFCAYHWSFGSVLYSSMPYAADAYLGECTANSSFPNSAAVDIVLSTTSHEQFETMTDPFGTGWYYLNNSGEIGDLCAYDYGTMPLDGGIANL